MSNGILELQKTIKFTVFTAYIFFRKPNNYIICSFCILEVCLNLPAQKLTWLSKISSHKIKTRKLINCDNIKMMYLELATWKKWNEGCLQMRRKLWSEVATMAYPMEDAKTCNPPTHYLTSLFLCFL